MFDHSGILCRGEVTAGVVAASDTRTDAQFDARLEHAGSRRQMSFYLEKTGPG
jgi:hypothetical protein